MGPPPVVSIHSNVAPRSLFALVGRAGRAARALTTAFSALALAVGVLTLAPAPARAADPITTQEYFSYYHFDAARAKGYTGKGVTIALIDSPVDINAPELAGADVTDKSRCTIEGSPEGVRHGTEMATILVSSSTGVAPDATLLSYQVTNSSSRSAGNCDLGGDKQNSWDKLINQAVEDGAQIISVSQGVSDQSDELKWAIANAISHGVIIVASAGNKSTDENSAHLSQWSGVVGTSAINTDGTFASYSSWGNGVVTAAVGGPYTTYDVSTGEPTTVSGTSVSTALAAGMIALARQKWPDATPNQILQLLVHTSLNPNHEWTPYTGYGAIDGGALVNTDPSQYPDENPILQKPGGSSPTGQEIQDYADGTITPNTVMNTMPKSYVYRGTNEDLIIGFGLDNGLNIHLGTSPRYHRK